MQLDARLDGGLAKKLQIAQAVAVVQKARHAVVAPLHDVLRDSGKVEAGQASHARNMTVASALRYRRRG